MAKKLQLPAKPEWTDYPRDSATSRERREAVEEWETDCRGLLENAWRDGMEIDWEEVPEEFRSLKSVFERNVASKDAADSDRPSYKQEHLNFE